MNNQDRELLELAALAAGMNTRPFATDSVTRWHDRDDGTQTAWNPLTDDGDALRLAVNLRLDVEFLRGGDFVKVSDYRGDTVIEIDHTGYPEADTRRAITRAAAKIGKGRG